MMQKNIKIKVGNLTLDAQLNDSKTAGLIYDKLPIEGQVRLWGEEIYFQIPVMADSEEAYAKDVVELGDLGYWPQGTAFCIFFGQTPISEPGKIRPATAVNVVGKISKGTEMLKTVKDSEDIIIERANS